MKLRCLIGLHKMETKEKLEVTITRHSIAFKQEWDEDGEVTLKQCAYCSAEKATVVSASGREQKMPLFMVHRLLNEARNAAITKRGDGDDAA